LKKYAAYTLLVIDEWLLDPPNETMRSMLLELLERRYDTASTVFCTQYAKKDWHLTCTGGGVSRFCLGVIAGQRLACAGFGALRVCVNCCYEPVFA